MALMDESVWRGRIFLGGWTAGGGGEGPVVEPATGYEIGRAGLAAPADVARAAQVAAAAQAGWAARPHTERAAILRRAGELWAASAAEIEPWGIREMGKIPPAMQFETHVATEEIFEAATLPSRPYGELLPSEQPRLSYSERVPAGVVGVIAPFNFPQILAIRSVAPALALGNAVILKPDPRTAVSGGAVLARVFEEAGLPDGLLHVLPGGADVGEAIIAEPAVRIISFTGSTAAGRRVGELAARHLKRVHLELGGNSALVVLDDVDLDRAASAGAWGSFLHQGQVCMTTGRHLVHESVYDDYVARLADKAGNLPVGDRRGAADAGLRQRGVRPGRAGDPVLHPGRRGQARRRQRVRPVAGHPDPRRDARPRPGPADPDRHRAHQRPDRRRRTQHPVRRPAGLGDRRPVRRGG
jgi:benzaldehyde dehydrogenase (NAD)